MVVYQLTCLTSRQLGPSDNHTLRNGLGVPAVTVHRHTYLSQKLLISSLLFRLQGCHGACLGCACSDRPPAHPTDLTNIELANMVFGMPHNTSQEYDGI
eukprot:scaffold162284_cov17-Tisochrysis_lutea.AAC.1